MTTQWEKAAGIYYEGIEQDFAWMAGCPFRGFTLKPMEGGWLLVIRTASVRRGALVAFYGGHTPRDCWEQFVTACKTKPGVNWKEDKYA
jgi:hypothetical protein